MLTTSAISAPYAGGVNVFIERAQALLPALKGCEPDAKKLRSVRAQTVKDLRRNLLFRVLQPVRLN